MAEQLSQSDVGRLLADPTPGVREELAVKVAKSFDPSDLKEREKKLAEDIFRLMLKDAEVRVRRALSENLRENGGVPHDVAVALANDVDQVALPMIESSVVLSDDDLLAIINSQGGAKQVAVAARPQVSSTLSDALVDTGNTRAVTRLVENEGADITDATFNTVVDQYGEVEDVQTAMVNRATLPVTVAEQLVSLVSESLRAELVKRHEMPSDLTSDLLMQTRERATLSLSDGSSVDEVTALVRQMNAHGRLTPSVIMRALCLGDITFFECAMALLSGVSLSNARRLIHDRGPLGLRAVFDKARLPLAQYIAVRAAVDVSKEMEMDGGQQDRERYARRMVERIMTQYDDLGVEFQADDLDYLLTKLDQLPPSITDTVSTADR